MDILCIRNLKVKLGNIMAVDNVSLNIQKGNVLGLVGESGCGKTALALSIMGLLPSGGKIVSGEILFKGHNILHLSEKEKSNIRGQHIGMIFQDPLSSLNPVFTIADQITEPLIAHTGRKQAIQKAINMLKKVGIDKPEERIWDYPHQFSGGQRQRIMIAAFLMLEPSLLIADEPTTALDVSVQAEILNLLKKLQQEMDLSVLFISHDLGVIHSISDKIAVMYMGWIVEEGEISEIFENPMHPYTKALLDAVPQIYGNQEELKGIKGYVSWERIEGCKFHPRCPNKKEICTQKIPPTIKTPTRSVKCWLANCKEKPF